MRHSVHRNVRILFARSRACLLIGRRSYTEDHHLIMDRLRPVCRLCREAGRTAHPGSENNNAPGGILYKYVY